MQENKSRNPILYHYQSQLKRVHSPRAKEMLNNNTN